MKKAKRPSPRREIFVLTPGEKRAAALVAAAFLLGLGTMHYRARHPPPLPPPTAKELRQAKRDAARIPSPRARPTPGPNALRASPAASREPPAREKAD
jgi:hypothetical protein